MALRLHLPSEHPERSRGISGAAPPPAEHDLTAVERSFRNARVSLLTRGASAPLTYEKSYFTPDSFSDTSHNFFAASVSRAASLGVPSSGGPRMPPIPVEPTYS